MLVFGVAPIFGFGNVIAFSDNSKYITMTVANMGNMFDNISTKTKMHNTHWDCTTTNSIVLDKVRFKILII